MKIWKRQMPRGDKGFFFGGGQVGGGEHKTKQKKISVLIRLVCRHTCICGLGGFRITRKKQCSKGNHQHICSFLFSSCLPWGKCSFCLLTECCLTAVEITSLMYTILFVCNKKYVSAQPAHTHPDSLGWKSHCFAVYF